jgi:hypothetical protein
MSFCATDLCGEFDSLYGPLQQFGFALGPLWQIWVCALGHCGEFEYTL